MRPSIAPVPDSSSSTTNRLREAVHQHRRSTRRGLLERLFTLWFRGFVYNQIWEDPRIDARALQLDASSRVVTIASGGCNVLNYLTHDPASVVALDLNAAHMALTRLKLAALEHLPSHDAFYDFFGRADQAANLDRYRTILRPHLDSATRRYWERRVPPLGRQRIRMFETGLYDRGRLSVFLRLVHGIARHLGHRPEALLAATTQDEQAQFFDEVVAPFFRSRLVQWLAGQPMTVFSLGIPPQQHRAMAAHARDDIIELYLGRLRKLVCGFPIHDNYFAWQAFGQRYDHARRRALPAYLRGRHYDRLRARLHRIDTQITSYEQFLATQPDNAHNAFVLLDAQDWMPAAKIAALWQQMARVGRPGTRVIFRTAGTASPVEAALPDALRRRFTYHRASSEALHDQDRSAIYGMFHLYELTA
jgi:S-adenosylmethionine-diacylglycerol 3-amino-3-carboxypropyl transferase